MAKKIIICTLLIIVGCKQQPNNSDNKTVPHKDAWGIYTLDLATENVQLIFSSSKEIEFLHLNNAGNKFTFSQKVSSIGDESEEIFTITINGSNLTQLTNNNYQDIYPCFSPDDSKIAFLSKRGTDLDIYVMNADGGNVTKLYDSGDNDADISWGSKGRITFTRNFQIWTIKEDGTDAKQLTNPPRAGQWGKANLPFGDYDPRFDYTGTKIVFERLENDISTHGNYNLYLINVAGTGEVKLTSTDCSQGVANWSHSGNKLVYIVAAIGSDGKYDIYMINTDSSNDHNITPGYFPANFLCFHPIFSLDDSKIYFIGQWW
jgi:TolB protein